MCSWESSEPPKLADRVQILAPLLFQLVERAHRGPRNVPESVLPPTCTVTSPPAWLSSNGPDVETKRELPSGSAESAAAKRETTCSPLGVPILTSTDFGVSEKGVLRSGWSKYAMRFVW